MKERAITPDVLEFIAKNCDGRTNKQLTEMVNLEFGTCYKPDSIKGIMSREHIKRTVRGKKPLFPPEIEAFIKEHIDGTSAVKMARMIEKEFGRKTCKLSVLKYYKQHGLSSGLTGRWGERNPADYYRPDWYLHPNCLKARFKKGNIPAKHREVGSTRVRTDGFLEIKVAEPSEWRLMQLVVWEENFGKIPEGMVVRFKDGDKTHVDPDNLRLVKRSEHLQMNAIASGKLSETAYALVKLREAVREKSASIYGTDRG